MNKRHSIWNRQLAGVVAMLLCTAMATYAGGGRGGGGGGRGGGGGGFGGGGFGGAGGGGFGGGGGGGGGGVARGGVNSSASAYGTATFAVDPNTHQIIVYTDPETYEQVKKVMAGLDQVKSQVLIKVVFMEVQHSDSSEIGLNATYTGQNSALSALTTLVTNRVASADGTSVITSYANQLSPNIFAAQNLGSAAASGASGIYSVIGSDFTATLNAIAQNGKAELLSRPSVLVEDGQPAQIHVGQSVPLITGVSYTTSGNNTIPILTPTYTSVGIQLDVTPFIAANNNVEMIVAPQISSVDPTLSQVIAEGVSVPALNVRSADTVVITPDGQTIVIGGLMENIKASSESKVPFLGDIPFLGNLFKDKKKSSDKSELVIFLTPHIVRGSTQLAAMSEREHKQAIPAKSFSEELLDQFLDRIPMAKEKN